MPPARQCAHRSARLQANARGCLRAMELPPQPPESSRIGKGRGQRSNTQKITVYWTRPSDLRRTDILVQHITTHSADAHVLFYEGKKAQAPALSDGERACGKDKGEIYQALAKLIFEKGDKLSHLYAQEPKTFDKAVGNRVGR
jgi:hypothetical protein